MNTKFVKLLFTTGLCLLFLTLLASAAFAQPKLNSYRGGLDDRFSTYNGVIAPMGSIVEIYDQDGTLCARDTIADIPGAGKYGNVSVIGDDPNTAEDEGPSQVDETLVFELNGRVAVTTGPDEPIWDGIALPFKEVNLEAEGIVDDAFTPPDGQIASPGDLVHYDVIVENTGNGIDFFTITATSSNGWIVQFYDGFHYAWPGETINVGFDLLIPSGTVKTSDQIEFTVTSGIDESVTIMSNVLTMIQEPTDVDEDNSAIPGDFRLHQNYPNPFNPATTIMYDLPRNSNVGLFVFDILGQKVNEFSFGIQTAGSHSFTFDAGNLPTGIYFYKLETDEASDIKKMILLK